MNEYVVVKRVNKVDISQPRKPTLQFAGVSDEKGRRQIGMYTLTTLVQLAPTNERKMYQQYDKKEKKTKTDITAKHGQIPHKIGEQQVRKHQGLNLPEQLRQSVPK